MKPKELSFPCIECIHRDDCPDDWRRDKSKSFKERCSYEYSESYAHEYYSQLFAEYLLEIRIECVRRFLEKEIVGRINDCHTEAILVERAKFFLKKEFEDDLFPSKISLKDIELRTENTSLSLYIKPPLLDWCKKQCMRQIKKFEKLTQRDNYCFSNFTDVYEYFQIEYARASLGGFAVEQGDVYQNQIMPPILNTHYQEITGRGDEICLSGTKTGRWSFSQ